MSRQAGRIRISATDNVQVTRVLIMIMDQRRQTLEQGEAALANDTWWEYETSVSTEGNVIVEAFDLAGNCTKLEA